MDTKKLVWGGVIVGSTIGGLIPELLGSSSGFLSFSSIIWSTIGGIAGIFIGYKISTYL